MAIDLALLTSTPDIRSVPPIHARIVCALRYTYMARARRSYCARELAGHLGSPNAVHDFHVFLDEAGSAWPEPISLNPACQPRMSYDEMLLADCATAAARNEAKVFEHFLNEMLGDAARRSLWTAARRLMKSMGVALV